MKIDDLIGARVYVLGKGIGMVVKVLKGSLAVKLDDNEKMIFAFPIDCLVLDLAASKS